MYTLNDIKTIIANNNISNAAAKIATAFAGFNFNTVEATQEAELATA